MVDAAAVRVVGCVDCRLDMAGCGATDGTSSEPTESSQRRDNHTARQAVGALVARTVRIDRSGSAYRSLAVHSFR